MTADLDLNLDYDYGNVAVVDADVLRARALALVSRNVELRTAPELYDVVSETIVQQRNQLIDNVRSDLDTYRPFVLSAKVPFGPSARPESDTSLLFFYRKSNLLFMLGFLSLALVIAVAIWLETRTPMPWRLLYIFLTAAVGISLCIVGAVRAENFNASGDAQHDELNIAIEKELAAQIRAITESLESAEDRWSNTFSATDAPALVESDASDAVPTRTRDKIRAFILDHRTSAIGVAGPRGSGKSTIMDQIRALAPASSYTVRIPAPVYYSADEFTKLIHTEVAYAASSRSDELTVIDHNMPRIDRSIVRAVHIGIGLIAVSLLGIAVLVDSTTGSTHGFHVDWAGAWALTAIGAAVIILVNVLAALAYQLPVWFRNTGTIRGLAQRQLDYLTWTRTRERTGGIKLSNDVLEASGEHKFTQTERDQTHAQSVRALRQFLEALVNRMRTVGRPAPQIIVCIDELDKIENPDHAIEVINSLKDLFHIPGVHFLLSVSTDALNRFAARGIPVRDVFDSSFDTIIEMQRLSFDEARRLIARRARHFCAPAVMFCYAWSGGNARDLIRTARTCVEQESDTSVSTLVRAILRHDVADVATITARALASAPQPDQTAQAPATEAEKLFAFRDLLNNEIPLTDIVDSAIAAGQLPHADFLDATEAGQLAAAFDSYAQVAALTEQLFAVDRTFQRWQQADMAKAADALACVRASLGHHPVEIKRLIEIAARACSTVAANDRAMTHQPVPAQPAGI